MPRRGSVYLAATPLPGESSGGDHLVVVVSTDGYNSHTGYPVVCGVRRGSQRHPFRIGISASEFRPCGRGRPLDGDRVVELGQSVGVRAQDLGELVGCVAESTLARIAAAIPDQFQLGATTWLRRGQIWTLTPSGESGGPTEVVLVANDRALGAPNAQHVLCLPASGRVAEAPMLMISPDRLAIRSRSLSADEQAALDGILTAVFLP